MFRMFITILFVAMVWALHAQSQSPLFIPAPGSPVAVGAGSGLIILADVNRDGRPDLVTQHLMQKVVTVQLGDGIGRFTMAPGSPITLTYSPAGIKLGDINGDGLPDFCVAGGERNIVDIFLGDGSGKFTLAPGSPSIASTSAQFTTHGLQLEDINGDRKLDVIAMNTLQNTFYTLLGNGRGGFSPGPTSTFPAGEGRYAFAFGDLDGDGNLDAVAASGNNEFIEPGRVIMLRGDGKGAFKTASETPIVTGPRYVTIGDVNSDGRPDLVLNHSSHQLSVLLNQGSGKFAPAPALTYDLGADAFAVAVADVNRDKNNDLIVATVDSVTVLLNGKNKFIPASGSPFRAGPGTYHLALGDVNKDGKLDIAASSFEGKAVTLLLGQ